MLDGPCILSDMRCTIFPVPLSNGSVLLFVIVFVYSMIQFFYFMITEIVVEVMARLSVSFSLYHNVVSYRTVIILKYDLNQLLILK